MVSLMSCEAVIPSGDRDIAWDAHHSTPKHARFIEAQLHAYLDAASDMPIATPIEPQAQHTVLRVAISGGGPAGLAAAIALRRIPGVEVTIYEQARELREIGAGLRAGFNSWRVLELLGVDHDVHGHKKVVHEHRDGTTGELQYLYPPHYGPERYHEIRARRTILQKALKDALPDEIVKLRKRLLSLNQLPKGGVRLTFEDGTTVDADLVIGADGIRSAVRKATYPSYETQYNGTTIWRTLVPLSTVQHLDLVKSTCFHHGPNTTFKCSIVSNPEEVAAGKGLWEMTLRYREDPTEVTEKKFSWGISATNERVASHFTAFTPQIREAINLVPEGEWREFSAFSGSCLEHVTANDNTLLIGDASHPMLGAFGSGAAFAMQDGWLYAQALDYFIRERQLGPREAVTASLKLFDEVRGPYYHRMYKYMAEPNVDLSGKFSTQSPDPSAPLYWVFGHDIGVEWEKIRTGLDRGDGYEVAIDL